MTRVSRSIVALCGLAVSLVGSDLAAQASRWDSSRAHLTREQLQELRNELGAASSGGVYSAAVRGRAGEELALIDKRLRDGDFQVGDRIIMTVRGETELTDTFTVGVARKLELPQVGVLELTGVLRSELQPRLREHLARFIRDPDVQVQSLIRLAVLGEVRDPGFHLVQPETPLADMLAVASGATAEADVRKLKVEREGRIIWEGEPLQSALAEGRTLDQMSLQAGDLIEIPRRPSENTWRTVLTILVPVLSVAVAASQIF